MMVGALVTVRVTGINNGLFDTPAAETVICSWYTPGASPAGLTEAVMGAGVLPPPVRFSQFPPVKSCVPIVIAWDPRSLLITRVRDGSSGPLIWYAKASEVGCDDNIGALDTVSTTGT
jgi:hypothetical protein